MLKQVQHDVFHYFLYYDTVSEGEGNRYVPPPSRGRSGGGWGICRSAPCVQRPHLWVKISLSKGGRPLSSLWYLFRVESRQREVGRDFTREFQRAKLI